MPECPYAGLMPFTEEQAPYFFGRDREREIIIANLMASRLTLLYGPSGVGKSSVLNAGVLHRLRGQVHEQRIERGSADIAVVSFRTWRDDPLPALERAIADEAGATGAGATFADRLQSCAEHVGGDVLIILDQFEEYFMYHPGEDGEGTFAVEFPRAVNRRDLRASFLVSMREDSIAKLDFFKGRIPNLFDNYLRVERLDRRQAREAIEGPIAQFNRLEAPADGHVRIEAALVEDVLDQVRASDLMRDDRGRAALAGADEAGIETPHLQLVMTRLWQEERAAGSPVLRAGTLRRIGGASEIVRTHVDAALDALTPAERDAAARMFQYLVTPAGTKIALGVEDLHTNAGLPPPELRALLVRLSSGASRILTTVAPAPDQPARERYQIFHDVLAEKVLAWRTRYVRAAEQRAAEAEAAEQRLLAAREAAAAARLRGLLAVVGVLLVLSVVATWWAWQQRQSAQAGQRAADQARLEALRSREQAEVARYTSRENEVQVLAERARNASLEQERRNFQLTAEAAEARLAGRLAEAERLRREAEVAARTAVAEKATVSRLEAERAVATREKEAAMARAQQLDAQQVAAAVPVGAAVSPTSEVTPARSEPSKGPVPGTAVTTTPPTPSAATPAPPPPAPVGDYRQVYRAGIDAKNRRQWQEALTQFQRAAELHGVDTGERIRISGFGNIEPYLPKYYAGVALKQLNRCNEALEAWAQSERDGAVQRTGVYKTLQQDRQACLAHR